MDRLERLNSVRRDLSSANIRPRDAASLVVLDRSGGTLRVLIGKRHPDQLFVPNKFVFPGGRIDRSDYRVAIDCELPRACQARLMVDMKGRKSEGRARALALTAIRETFEETGLTVAVPGRFQRSPKHGPWSAFHDRGVIPAVAKLRFVARAITPPGRPRRYDTRFFCVLVDELAATPASGGDGELTELHWASLEEARNFDLHPMTRTILDDVEEQISPDLTIGQPLGVPYYFMRAGHFHRTLIGDDLAP